MSRLHAHGMPKFKKAILEAGRTYKSPDGPLVVTKDRLVHWRDTFNQMDRKGIGIPIGWDHDDDPDKSVPVKFSSTVQRKRPAKDTAGYLHAFRLIDGGKRAELTIDVRGKENIRRVDDNLAYISPVVFAKWQDGDGEKYSDCFTHVDLVQHPVDHRQTPFERVDEENNVVACAIRMGLDTGKPALYRLQAEDEDMADHEDEDGGGEEETVADDEGRLKEVIEALATMNPPIVLSPDTNGDNFLEHLHQSVLTLKALESGDDVSGNTDHLDVEQPEFAALSLGQRQHTAYINKQHQLDVAKRFNLLLPEGRCTPVEEKARKPKLKAVRLSLNDAGDHSPGELETWIEAREAVPKGTFWSAEQRTRMSQMEVAEHPKDLETDGGAPPTEEEADEIVAEINRRN